MNYRHAYHAGNFADVFKHVVLAILLKSLHKKSAPFSYLDTHAGAGRYDLAGEAAQKTGEYHAGIEKLWGTAPLPELADYLAAVHAINPSGRLRYYPGSPLIARHFLRANDRMILLEQHPAECAALRSVFSRDRRIQVREQDGYAGLDDYLPPPQRRGLVLIDPPFESNHEFDRVLAGLRRAHDRWASGIFAVWFPIKNREPIERFYRILASDGIRKILTQEFCPYPDDVSLRLNGCGMIVVNPPWKFEETLQLLIPKISKLLQQPNAGRSRLAWLVPE